MQVRVFMACFQANMATQLYCVLMVACHAKATAKRRCSPLISPAACQQLASERMICKLGAVRARPCAGTLQTHELVVFAER